MNISDAYGVIAEGEPDISLKYICTSCDTDYSHKCFCCGKEVTCMVSNGMNTPYQEWQLANAVAEMYRLEKKTQRIQSLIDDLADGSRYR